MVLLLSEKRRHEPTATTRRGKHGSERKLFVTPLADVAGLDTYRWIFVPHESGYEYIVNVTNGLVIGETPDGGVSDWSINFSDGQLWKMKNAKGSSDFDNKKVLINKQSGKALVNDWNVNWAVAWVHASGTVTAGGPSIVPGESWRIENGASG